MPSDPSCSVRLTGPIRLRLEVATAPWQLAASVLLALVATAAGLSIPLFVRVVIAGFGTPHAWRTPVLLAGAAVVGAVAQAGSAMLLARVGERMVYAVRVRLMRHTLDLPLTTVRRQGIGNLSARITSDALLLRQIVEVGTQLPVAVLTVAGTFVAMLWIDWLLTLVTVVSLVLVTTSLMTILRRVKANVIGQQDAVGRISQRFVAHLEALTTIKAYRAEALAGRALAGDAAQLRTISLRGARLLSVIPAVTALGNQFAMLAVILVGGARIAGGDLPMAAFAAFLLYLLQAIPPATALTQSVGRLQVGRAALQRCNELLAQTAEAATTIAVTAPTPDRGAPAVVFDAVATTYPGALRPALHGVSFRAAAVGLTAVVGASGAGKTTALSLIERFLDADAGRIAVLGHDLLDWPVGALRDHIAFVDQSFTLLEGTVRENLSLGRRTDLADDELIGVLAAVGLDEDVAALPDGLDTVLGRRTNLSGGQNQRVALARALLSNAPIVLLDEPTSQLDGINEQRFRTIVAELATRRAVIVVAHRLSTVQQAQHVVMFDAGKVVDAAEHTTLLRRCAAYRELVATQALASSSDSRLTPAILAVSGA